MEKQYWIFWVLIILLVGLALLSLLNVNVPPPAPWLEAWTKWLAAAVGTVVSARVLWTAALVLHKKFLP